MLRGMNQRSLPIAYPAHLMALELQSLLQEQSESRIIFNDQNSHFFISKAESHQHRKSHYQFGRVCNYLGSSAAPRQELVAKFCEVDFKMGIAQANVCLRRLSTQRSAIHISKVLERVHNRWTLH